MQIGVGKAFFLSATMKLRLRLYREAYTVDAAYYNRG